MGCSPSTPTPEQLFKKHADMMKAHMYNLWVLSYTLPINDIVNTPINTITDTTNIPILPMPDELRICVLYSRCNTITPEELPNKIDEYTYKQKDVNNYNPATVIENVTRVLTDFKTSLQSLISVCTNLHIKLGEALDSINNSKNMMNYSYISDIRKCIQNKYNTAEVMRSRTNEYYDKIIPHTNEIIAYINKYIGDMTNNNPNNNITSIPIFDNYIKCIDYYINTYIVCLRNVAYSENGTMIIDKIGKTGSVYIQLSQMYCSTWCAANLAELVLYVVKTNKHFPNKPDDNDIDNYKLNITTIMQKYQGDASSLDIAKNKGTKGEPGIMYDIKWDSSKPAHYVHIMKYLNNVQKQYCIQYISYYEKVDINATWVDKYLEIAKSLCIKP